MEDDDPEPLHGIYENKRTHAWLPVRQMSGENVELIKLAVDTGISMGFVISLSRATMFGEVVRFNDLTGRIFLLSGPRATATIRNFLIREVKLFECPAALFDEWMKRKQ